MSRSSCISHPASDPLIIIHRWQLEFCINEDGKTNECAAALLSFLEYWHNNKLDISKRNRTANDAFEREGKRRPLPESLLQWHSTAEIEAGLLIFKRSSIQAAIDFLVKKQVVEVHRNPVLRYDNTKHFLFKPEILTKWLSAYEPNSEKPPAENSRPPAENSRASTENSRTIPETSSETSTEKTKTKTRPRAERSPVKALAIAGTAPSSSFSLCVDEEEMESEGSDIAPSPGLVELESHAFVLTPKKETPKNGNGYHIPLSPTGIDSLLEEFGPFSAGQRRDISDEYEQHPNYVLRQAGIVRSEPRDNLAKSFLAALRDDWQPRTSTIKPKTKVIRAALPVDPAMPAPGEERPEMTEAQRSGFAAMKLGVTSVTRPPAETPLVSPNDEARQIERLAERYPDLNISELAEVYRQSLAATGTTWREGAFRRQVSEAADDQMRGRK